MDKMKDIVQKTSKAANQDIQIVQVVAMSQNRTIGKNNQLLWHIPEDLRHFKRLTSGGVIVMGRKTFESLPNLLPNRIHHVISRQADFVAKGVTMSATLDEAIVRAKADAKSKNQDKIFIIGGGQIYQQSLAICDVLEITEVDIWIDGDVFYPIVDTKFDKVYQSQMHRCPVSGLNFCFTRWERL